MTNQRSKVELDSNHDLHCQDLWAGGTDGVLRRWSSPHLSIGAVEPCWQSKLHEGMFYCHISQLCAVLTRIDIINSTSIHQTADVFATAGGQWDFLDANSDFWHSCLSSSKNLLKLWTISRT